MTIIRLNSHKTLPQHINIDDDFLLRMTAENVYKPMAKRAKSASRFYTAQESDTHEYIVIVFIQHRVHSRIKF